MISQQLLGTLVAALIAFVSGGALSRVVERWSTARAKRHVSDGDAAKLEAKASVVEAETEKIEASALIEAFRDLQRRLDGCEKKHEAAEARERVREAQIAMMQRQIDADADLIEKLAAKIEAAETKTRADESLIRGMRAELDDLRRVVRGVQLRKAE